MYRRTFEILAKYVGHETGVKVIFDTDGGAHANMKTNEIHLPANIGKDNALGALALLMHEAAHIRYSKKIPMDKLIKSQEDHMILNACEDVRIDQKNFYLLDNVRDFYKELVKKHIDIRKSQAPQEVKALCAGIFLNENFKPKMDDKTKDIITTTDLCNEMRSCEWAIDSDDWKEVAEQIKNIKKTLGIKPSQETPLTEQEKVALGIIPGDKDGDKEIGVGTGDGEGESLADQLEGLCRPASGFGTGGEPMKGPGYYGEVDLDAITQEQFKELLVVKERKIIKNGSVLDTDNLIAYYTGDPEELFKEEEIKKVTKSKLLFLIDASGSMGCTLMDNKPRAEVVKKCISSLVNILEEVRHSESIDVSWTVAGFTYNYHPYNNDTWEQEYNPGGGTSIERGVQGAIADMMKDHTIDGKRILVLFSDGDVSPGEIETVIHMIRAKGSDIRTLVVGVGTELTGKMATDIVGDNIILCEEDASNVLLETVKAML
jgi:hypothetical protein